MKISSTSLLCVLVLTLTGLTNAVQSVPTIIGTRSTADTPATYSPLQKLYYNATQQKYVTAWGVEANITYTNPNLNGGTFSAHRVVLNQQSPWRYTEVGWVKYSSIGLGQFVSYDDGIVGPRTEYFWGLSPTTHLYSSQYDPNTGRHWFYLDGTPFFNRAMNFTSGDRVIGGGEVLDGIESMGRTLLTDLAYSVNLEGSFFYTP